MKYFYYLKIITKEFFSKTLSSESPFCRLISRGVEYHTYNEEIHVTQKTSDVTHVILSTQNFLVDKFT